VSALRANALVTSVRIRLLPALQTRTSPAPADADRQLSDGLKLLADQGLVATIETGASEIGRVADLARRFPQLQVVFDHFGWPDDLSEAGRRTHLAALHQVADQQLRRPVRRVRRHLRLVFRGRPAAAVQRHRAAPLRPQHARVTPVRCARTSRPTGPPTTQISR
jgi:Amidohydrolase